MLGNSQVRFCDEARKATSCLSLRTVAQQSVTGTLPMTGSTISGFALPVLPRGLPSPLAFCRRRQPDSINPNYRLGFKPKAHSLSPLKWTEILGLQNF
jgi:hypothetical protein